RPAIEVGDPAAGGTPLPVCYRGHRLRIIWTESAMGRPIVLGMLAFTFILVLAFARASTSTPRFASILP
ncbi:hypothetical protein, partial [Mesorhizobium sp.]|uniref:hypothetical protein n=1 Tax=Mesorhizobium sp. TaxID=1871066 RepID=UPI00257B655E